MPYGIAIDPEAQLVYWSDRKAGVIQRLSLQCGNGSLEVPSRMTTPRVKARFTGGGTKPLHFWMISGERPAFGAVGGVVF